MVTSSTPCTRLLWGLWLHANPLRFSWLWRLLALRSHTFAARAARPVNAVTVAKGPVLSGVLKCSKWCNTVATLQWPNLWVQPSTTSLLLTVWNTHTISHHMWILWLSNWHEACYGISICCSSQAPGPANRSSSAASAVISGLKSESKWTDSGWIFYFSKLQVSRINNQGFRKFNKGW